MMNADQTNNDVEVQQLKPQPVLSIRATVQIDQLGEVMGDRLQALQSYLRQYGAQPAGPPFVCYHTFGETETDLETGVPVAAPIDGEGRIVAGELSGGPSISTWHTGPHDKLGDAYARIEAWLKEHAHERGGPAREVYHWIDLSQDLDPSKWDPSTWGTQLVQPIKYV
jgi:effector-binding domain-containing protein